MAFRNATRVPPGSLLDGVTITGSSFVTSDNAQGGHIEIDAGALSGFSGSPDEIQPGSVDPRIDLPGTISETISLRLLAPAYAGSNRGLLEMLSSKNGDDFINIVVNAANITMHDDGLIVIKDTIGGPSGGVKIGPSGDGIREGIKWGKVTTQNTDANGDITINHQLGAVPTLIGFQGINPFFFHRVIDASIDGNQFKLRCASTAGVVFGAGQPISGFWWVIR